MQHLVASCMLVLKHFVEDFVEDDELQSVEEFILFLRQFFPHVPSEC